MHEAERGLFDLLRGRPLYVTTPAGQAPQLGILLATVEGLSGQTLDQLRRLDGDAISLAVTHHRARAMGVANGGRASDMILVLSGNTTPV